MSMRPGKKDTKMRFGVFPMVLEDTDVEDRLKRLKNAYQMILEGHPTNETGEDLYRSAYTLVLYKRGEELYSALKQVITKHLVEKVRKDVEVSDDDNFLNTLNAVWNEYQVSMMYISRLVMYMNLVYVQQNGLDNSHNLGVILFRDLVARYGSIRDRLCQALLSLVRKEREGQAVHRMAIRNTCEMLMKQGIGTRDVYEDVFEKPFLQESAEFYKLECQKFLAENNASIYLQKVETKLNQEAELARNFLDPTTEEPIVKLVEEELIHKHMEKVIEMENSGVDNMLKHNRLEDLARMCRLFNRVKGKNNGILMDWLKIVHGCIRKYFPEEAKELEGSEDPATFIQKLERILNLMTENKVPPEILARGPLALEAYNKALSEGRTCLKRVPVMVIGQERSGKTSLKKSLIGEPFNPDEDSTVGIDVDPSHFKVSTEIWKVGEKDQETNSGTTISYEHHAARLTVENLRKEKRIATEGVSQEPVQFGNIPLVGETSSGTVSSDSISASPATDVINASSHDSSQVGIGDLTSVSSAAAVPNTSRQDSANSLRNLESPQTSRHPQPGGTIAEMPEETATLIEMLLKEDDKVKDEKEDIYSVLWDFAGQSVFYTTHPLFLTARAIYLLVNDISQSPFESAKPIVTQGMFSEREDAFCAKTNLDYLDLWMASVASLAIEDEGHQEGHDSEVLTKKLPPVFLVCTHADKPYDGRNPDALARKVLASLRNKSYKTHLYGDVFVVDNTKSGHSDECPGIILLRQKVLDLAKELPQLKEAIPIKWLRYEKTLQTMSKNGHKWISFDSAKQIASEVCNIVDENQFQTLLNFLHDQRTLIHFSDTPNLNRLVVLDLQWLIDVFKRVITVRPFNHKEQRFEELWCKLEEKGLLEETLLEHVWGPLFDNKETPESLLEIMEKFSLLCHWPSSDASCFKQYLVPSMLMSHPPEGITQLVESAQIPPLFLKFESGKIPLGLFPRLVLQFFQWSKGQYKSAVDPQLYHNFARFYASKDCSVVLLCHLSFIEVVFLGGSPVLELAENLQSKLTLSAGGSHDNFEGTCARAVRRQLGLMLESMRNEFCWLKNMKYEVCFLCPVCCQGGKVNCCRKHRADGCKQEECLHFWSESDLRNTKINVCAKYAVAQKPTVQMEQFAPWSVLTGNQLAVNGDGRNVCPVEGSKEIALPSEVQKALLSQNCDAKEIVIQLKESLQLDQASLEQPESGTKTLIRCFAREAKDSNRLDVFKHLREITPAGTTGPVLPERLDVRSIPVCQGRELTIDLSGGEEWKVVAEGLGLTPKEIRYLDKRTLNPFDAALAFTANTRLLTVGELYDLLTRSGFPVLADLL